MKTIPLTRGMFAVVDDADFDLVSEFKWSAHKGRNTFYAYNSFAGLMHRLLTKPPKGAVVDHRDRNGLNNQRSNLRVCSMSENCENAKAHFDNKSGFKGVSWDSFTKSWRAVVSKGGRRWRGRFSNPVDAAKMHDRIAALWFGEFAKTNESLGLV
jgi:hypothetical protein